MGFYIIIFVDYKYDIEKMMINKNEIGSKWIFFFIKMEVFIDSIKIIIIFYFFKLNIYIGFCIILILLLFYMVIIIFID